MSHSQPHELMAVGHVARPHGLRGELSVIVLAPPIIEPNELIVDQPLFLRSPGDQVRPIEGEWVRPHQGRWLVKLKGLDAVGEVEGLRGWDLCVTREQLPRLPEGWYWEADIERCRVVDEQLGEIGQADGLELGMPQPQLVLIRPDGRRATIPWVKAFVREVDLGNEVIRTDLPADFPGISDEK